MANRLYLKASILGRWTPLSSPAGTTESIDGIQPSLRDFSGLVTKTQDSVLGLEFLHFRKGG